MDGDAQRLAREQAALRRVAAFAAGDSPLGAVFEAVVAEASALLDGVPTALMRYDAATAGGPAESVVVAQFGGLVDVGDRSVLTGDGIGVRLVRSRRSERIDDFAAVAAPAATRKLGLRGAVAAPVPVFGEFWGWLEAGSREGPLPWGAEDTLMMFAGIVASAVVNLRAVRGERRLAEEQSALLRVTALVARDAPSAEVFDAVTVEAAGLIDDEATTLVRYEGARTYRVLSTYRGPAPVGTRFTVPDDDEGTLDEMMRTLRPARRDRYDEIADRSYSNRQYGVGSSVSVPVMVDGRLWGSLGTLNEGRRLPPDTEARLGTFAELISTALSNLEARAALERSAREQGALRRVAELVARGAALDEVFRAVTDEASSILGDAATHLARYDGDGITVVATCNSPVPVGLWTPVEPGNINATLRETAAPIRVEPFGEGDELPRRYGITSLVVVPVLVEGAVWGLLGTTAGGGPLPEAAEQRLSEFAELAAAAIANAENKAALRASRARVVATADETRQRMQRDVHDGVQQRLVQTVLTLQLAVAAVTGGEPGAAALVREALDTAERATGELRDLVQGILPASLTRGGLRAGLESLIADLPLPVDLDLAGRPGRPRLPAEVEVTAYFVVAEALTNVVKHARASRARVTVAVGDGVLVAEVADDGVGGADPRRGTGLTGLQDRVDALDGTLELTSDPGKGTTLRIGLPLS